MDSLPILSRTNPKNSTSKKIVRAIVLLVTASACGFAGYVAFKPKPVAIAEGTYTPVGVDADPAELQKVIISSVKVTPGFSYVQALRSMQVAKITSGGAAFKVYKFTASQLCGKAGCLHVIANQNNQVYQNYHLLEPSTLIKNEKNNCLTIAQPVDGQMENFNVCSGS